MHVPPENQKAAWILDVFWWVRVTLMLVVALKICVYIKRKNVKKKKKKKNRTEVKKLDWKFAFRPLKGIGQV